VALLERWRAGADGWAPLLSEPLLTLAFAHLGPVIRPGSTVVDVGCGAGHIANLFAGIGAVAIAFDLHAPTARAAHHSYPSVRVLTARAEQIPLRTGSADALFCYSVLQYSDRSASLAECRRVLRRGGRFVVIENLRGNPFARLYRRWRRLSRGYAAHLTPREHLDWRDRTIYERYFSRVDYTPFHIVGPMLTALRAVRENAGGRRARSAAATMVAAIDAVEGALLGHVPMSASLAWTLVVRGER
jgi:SAM-dependent methyltransferase